MNVRRCCVFVLLVWILDVRAAEAQCAFAVSPTSLTVTSLSDSRTISVVTGTQCSWTAASEASWITISSGTSGTGFGSTTFVVEPNPASEPRTGTLTVAGQTVSVTQGATSCTYTVTPAALSIEPASSSRVLSIMTGTQCAWTATSAVAWITIRSGAAGTGGGGTTLLVQQNPGAGPRTGTLTVAGQPVTVTQAGAASDKPPVAPIHLRFVEF